jgi:hypothetical protein
VKKFTRISTDNADLNQVQSNLESCLGPALASSIIDGVQLSNVVLKSGANTINNPLARNIFGIFVVRKNAAADIYDLQSTNSIPTKTIILQVSTAVTVDLWIY